MLQPSKSALDLEQNSPVNFMPSSDVGLQSVIGFVRRRYPFIIVSVALALCLGIIYLATTPPSFTARASMIIDTRKVQVFQQQSIMGDLPIDSASVESQVEILRSDNIALAVIKELHLTEDPEFTGSKGGLIGALFRVVFALFDLSDQPISEAGQLRSVVRQFQDRLTVKRVGLSYVIEIGFRSDDPDRAAQIANAIPEAYIVDQLEAKYQTTKRAGVWLQDRIRELREQASIAERSVVDFKTKNNIVGTSGRLMTDQQVSELSSQLVIARAQTSEAKARLDRIEAVLRVDDPNATVSGTVADTLKSEVVTKLRSQYLELSNRQMDWSARYGRDHLAAVNLRNQMREIRRSILEELARLGESYKSDYQIAKQREVGIQQELDAAVALSQKTNQAQVTLRELESNSQTYRSLYDNFLQRYMESVQQQSFPITEARVISQATRPSEKSHPKTSLVLALSAFGGIAVGLGLAFLRDMSDWVFRTGAQVESLLQLDCIALVPMVRSTDRSRSVEGERSSVDSAPSRLTKAIWAGMRPDTTALPHAPGSGGIPPDARVIVRNGDAIWTVVDAPFSRFSEAMRSVKLAIDLREVSRANKVIGFTSALPNEGKSTVAASLAQLIAQTGARCILVDCDLRNPTLSRLLAPHAPAGMLEVIVGKLPLDEAIWKEGATNLAFLPMVSKSRLAHSNEILSSDAMKKLFERLREHYDYVIADFSPLAPLVDVRATTHLVDSYVFVVEWGGTKIEVVQHTLEEAPGIYQNLLGAVLNKADMHRQGRYESYGYDYYSNKNYGRYGLSDER